MIVVAVGPKWYVPLSITNHFTYFTYLTYNYLTYRLDPVRLGNQQAWGVRAHAYIVHMCIMPAQNRRPPVLDEGKSGQLFLGKNIRLLVYIQIVHAC